MNQKVKNLTAALESYVDSGFFELQEDYSSTTGMLQGYTVRYGASHPLEFQRGHMLGYVFIRPGRGQTNTVRLTWYVVYGVGTKHNKVTRASFFRHLHEETVSAAYHQQRLTKPSTL